MNDITVRYAKESDRSFIIECQLKMALETENLRLDHHTVEQGVKAVFDDPLKGFYIVTEKEGKHCSCLMVTPEWSDWRNNWVWWIQSVYVVPQMRQMGIYGKMYCFIKSLVSENTEVAGIRLYVDNTNIRAREVYKRMGMTDEHYRLFEWMKA